MARQRLPVLGAPIDRATMDEARALLAGWAAGRESRVVCACNVHSVVTAAREPDFAAALAAADLTLPDGAPVAWMMRRLGARGQRRVAGPDLMLAACADAAAQGLPVFLYGSRPETLARLREQLSSRWPALVIAGSLSPPFGERSPADDEADVQAINASGAAIVWVGLGCPKQELWMAAHAGRVRAVMVGVGAAFDFHAGTLARAPGWMRECGLEWLHRLVHEPRRLWRRYLSTHTAFAVGVLRQWLGPR